MTTRRRFLASLAGSATLLSLSRSAPLHLLRAAEGRGGGSGESILVVVQLSGGNDGLSTVVPYGDDEYAKNRFTLRMGAGQIRKVDDYLGLHPSLGGLAELLDEGKLAIVQGVGYPNPNRSHFESMDMWQTAHRMDAQPVGWLGRYLDAAGGADGRDVPALHFGAEKQPLALTAEKVPVPSVRSLDRFRLEYGGDERLYESIHSSAVQPRAEGSDLLQFVQKSTAAALVTSRRVEQALGNYRTEVAWPGTPLAQKLRTVAQLIDAGLTTRIYYVSLDGFDTHSQQAQAHAGLLSQLGDSIAAFTRDIAAHGNGERVALMTFSEFGRRVKENASAGTDHGAAAPMFLAGGRQRSGVIGEHPSLTDLDAGDLKHSIDYRRVYAAVLEDWLGYASEPVLGERFEPLPLFA